MVPTNDSVLRRITRVTIRGVINILSGETKALEVCDVALRARKAGA
jgi:hypothetical protein